MKDILQDLADDHNKSLEKLKDVPERETTNNVACSGIAGSDACERRTE
ncbi:MAG: hypothetical protein IPP27_02285 [Bacteroidetes bacterium]|nr:hypothetical protein [Bacteroidota bacterium]